ncbi:unnamed protein product [Brassica rapa]|uniref:Uncharacterized protein n=2 Tax=Brassica TaxID=3705 RepID=A0A8D9CW33_BRACM|nr:unnamed protein product [Brassica napus]CAG7865942.1 unnamed protein product [Brassica rapa]
MRLSDELMKRRKRDGFDGGSPGYELRRKEVAVMWTDGDLRRRRSSRDGGDACRPERSPPQPYHHRDLLPQSFALIELLPWRTETRA